MAANKLKIQINVNESRTCNVSIYHIINLNKIEHKLFLKIKASKLQFLLF